MCFKGSASSLHDPALQSFGTNLSPLSRQASILRTQLQLQSQHVTKAVDKIRLLLMQWSLNYLIHSQTSLRRNAVNHILSKPFWLLSRLHKLAQATQLVSYMKKKKGRARFDTGTQLSMAIVSSRS